MWKGLVRNCSTVWIVTEINRAAAEKEAWDILESASSFMGNGGKCQQIHFICTKSDVFESLDDHSAAAIRAHIFKRNMKAKKEVKNEFNKLKKTKEYLQNLNDYHSETLNYASGAHGILSLIQGARRTEVPGNKKAVCTDLDQKLSCELEKVRESMREIYSAFEKCLNEGVEKSKTSCEGKLKSFLYPKRPKDSGFYGTLKCVVENGGTHKTKHRKQINLNMKLSSFLTDSIDEEFRKTFPNEGKYGPFNGIISMFSLDTEKLIQQFNDVELQLIFLKTEEEKIKTKLNKIIQERKKTIYSSLTETIEDAMQGCYIEAAGFKKDKLKNMRDTLEKHIHVSKNVMFEQAKNVMLHQLNALMEEILKSLENTLKEAINLSLKTDHVLVPDFSTELELVKQYYKELKGSTDE
ncbi:hypothetical protein Q5P01_017359 [Channa striata]|uniref:Uncharacterized protein n=1 Tax=Channa striata TaxID=64152 RepID=A0AA88M9V8_CHASR|nr:hypothetical protein Q5P01_017359 [Channa striata]